MYRSFFMYDPGQLLNNRAHTARHLCKQGQFAPSIHKENSQPVLFVHQALFKYLFFKPVSFLHQPFDPVSVHCFFEQLTRHNKTRLQKGIPLFRKQIVSFERKNVE